MKKHPRHSAVLLFATLSTLNACSQKDHGDSQDDGQASSAATSQVQSATSASTTSGTSAGTFSLKPGEVGLRRVQLTAGVPYNSRLALRRADLALQEQDSEGVSTNQEKGSVSTGTQPVELEVSILAADGSELAYSRSDASNATAETTPETTGDYLIAVKNNADEELAIEGETSSGASSDSGLLMANAEAKYPGRLLKAIVVLAEECHEYDSEKVNSVTVKAPAGSYYVQPFVFFGAVDAESKRVSPLSSATISIKSGDWELKLKALKDIPTAVYRESSGLTDDEHLALARNFYHGYFGSGGELYTIEQSWLNGDCDALVPLALPEDVGNAALNLHIDDHSDGTVISAAYPIRATIAPPFSLYQDQETKLSDWTQCTLDQASGTPKTYNGDAEQCKVLSLINPPQIRLDYKLPSAMSETDAITSVSDPTRALFYGHSRSRAFLTTLITAHDALVAGTEDSISLDSCLATGGLVAVPLGGTATSLPLGELNAQKDDVINLAYRSGSYTALTDFYQGNIEGGGELSLPTCLPDGTNSCDDYGVITVKVKACTVKADSGIATTSISSSFIYPSHFAMSGIITN